MKKLFLAGACLVLLPIMATAQVNDVDTCYSAECENGLNSMADGLQSVDLYMELEGLGIDGGFLFDGGDGPDPLKKQCVKNCAKGVKKSHIECIDGVSAAGEFLNVSDSLVRDVLMEACKERTKKKFNECRIKNDCAIF